MLWLNKAAQSFSFVKIGQLDKADLIICISEKYDGWINQTQPFLLVNKMLVG